MSSDEAPRVAWRKSIVHIKADGAQLGASTRVQVDAELRVRGVVLDVPANVVTMALRILLVSFQALRVYVIVRELVETATAAAVLDVGHDVGLQQSLRSALRHGADPPPLRTGAGRRTSIAVISIIIIIVVGRAVVRRGQVNVEETIEVVCTCLRGRPLAGRRGRAHCIRCRTSHGTR